MGCVSWFSREKEPTGYKHGYKYICMYIISLCIERENQESWYIIDFKAEDMRSGRRGEEF